MPFSCKELQIPDVKLIEPKIFEDNRGLFFEVFKLSDFKEFNCHEEIVQINHSSSTKNVLRGLHYQLNPKAQSKIVRVIAGEIFDIAVDIRKGSPYFGKWVGEILSAESRNMLYIPKGFAHGFCVLSDTAEMVYYISGGEYTPECDCGIIWNDPQINIDWPLDNPLLSDKDLKLSTIEKADNNFIYNEK